MKMFRQMTTGKVVVMGRKTLESFPNGMPLPKRTNIVLTHDKDYDAKGAIVVGSKEELLDELEEYKDEDIFIIGGESIYRMMLPYCDTAPAPRPAPAPAAAPPPPAPDIVIQLMLQEQTLHMMQILIFQIWMRCQSGNL